MSYKKKKLQYAIGGVSMTVIGTAFFMFMNDQVKTQDQMILDKLKELRLAISHHFQINSSTKVLLIQLSEMLAKKEIHILQLEDIYNKVLNPEQLKQDTSLIPFLNSLEQKKSEVNYQVQIMDVNMANIFLQEQRIDAVYEKFKKIPWTLMPHENIELTEPMMKFQSFVFNCWFLAIQELEVILTDKKLQDRLSQVNYFMACFLDWLQDQLKKNIKLSHLIAQVLLSVVGRKGYILGHRCKDQTYEHKIQQEVNKSCKCKLIDLVIRYQSLLSRKMQLKCYQIILESQLFYTQEQLTEFVNIIFKNTFYLGSQLGIDQMFYINELSPILYMGILGSINNQIRPSLVEYTDTVLLYIERMMNSNNMKFWAKSLKGIIALYCMIYPVFKEDCSQLFKDEQLGTGMIMHFFGVLMIMENKETYYLTQLSKDNDQMIEWIAGGMDSLFATEIITQLVQVFLKQIIKNNKSEFFQKWFFQGYIQCVRVVQSKKVEYSFTNRKMLEINVSLSKILSVIACLFGQKDQLPSKKTLESILKQLPFHDKSERRNIFSNFSKTLFDLPSMNLHFLKFIQQKCENISPEATVSYHSYFNSILSSSTLSYDEYMLTLQICFLFGDIDVLMNEIRQRIYNDLLYLDSFKEFLLRDILLLVDLMENPYYYINISTFTETNPSQEITKQLQIKAITSITQLNGDIQADFLLSTIKMFLNISTLPQDVISEVFEKKRKNKPLKLKQQYQKLYSYLFLQKDMDSVGLYIENIEKQGQSNDSDMFNDVYNTPSLPFIEDIKQKMFLNLSFQQLISLCILSQPEVRKLFYPWALKIVYYGKQVSVLKNITKKEKEQQSLNAILTSDYVQEFLNEMKGQKYCQKLIKKIKELK